MLLVVLVNCFYYVCEVEVTNSADVNLAVTLFLMECVSGCLIPLLQ